MQKLFLCLSILGMVLTGCSKNEDEDNGENEGKLPDLPALPDPDDVCSAMDDLNFMSYCYEKFDVNKDGKVSVGEANAVREINIGNNQIKSLKGIERFPNLKNIYCRDNPIEELDLRYNLSLISINKSAFYNCESLKWILLPNSLKTIEDSAFSQCHNLTNITLPQDLISIGKNAFYDCKSLKKILFPNSLKTIESFAFTNCSNLTYVSLPQNLISIGNAAFESCKSLTELVLFPANLTSIKEYTFHHCSNLTKVTCYALIPPKLDEFNFDEVNKIETLYVPAGSIQAYKDSYRWVNRFKNILPIK